MMTPSPSSEGQDLAALSERLLELLAKATPGPWEVDHEKNEGEYGEGPESRSGYNSALIISGEGKRLFDSLNSDAAYIHEKAGGDEHGDWLDAWDETSIANAELIVAAVNALPSLLKEAEGLRERLERHEARRFPIMGHKEPASSIPWSILAPHEEQAQRNHGQSLEKLASRGGLDWTEALAVLTGRRLSEQTVTEAEARKRVMAICEADVHAQLCAATKRASELDAIVTAAQIARDEAGFVGTIDDCIRCFDGELSAATKRAEAAEGALREIEAIELPAAAEVGHVTEALALVARCRVIARRARGLTGEGAERARCPSCNRTSLPHARGCPLAPATLEQKEAER